MTPDDLISQVSILPIESGDILAIKAPRFYELSELKRNELYRNFESLGVKVIVTNDETDFSVIRPPTPFSVPIKFLSLLAHVPTQARIGDAGFDLYSIEDYVLEPGERHLFKLGLSMAIPVGWYGRISPRSGRAFKEGLDVLAGTIDALYRDEVGVLLINLGNSPIEIFAGHKIAQMIFQRCESVQFQSVDELPSSDRGGGFGSTGS